jgi:uncharacterized membrane protein (UPF0127 family)
MAFGPVTHQRERRNLILVVLGAAVGVAAIVTIVLLVTRDNGSGSHASGSTTRTRLDDFGETHVTVETSSDTLAWCMLLAETEAQRDRGLMQVTDPKLGGYDGMVFRFDTDTDDAFYMRNTPMPLSIAFISSDGDVISTTDMAPCADREGCPLYHAAGPYRTAIEVPQGNLDRLGIASGNKVTDDHRTC